MIGSKNNFVNPRDEMRPGLVRITASKWWSARRHLGWPSAASWRWMAAIFRLPVAGWVESRAPRFLLPSADRSVAGAPRLSPPDPLASPSEQGADRECKSEAAMGELLERQCP